MFVLTRMAGRRTLWFTAMVRDVPSPSIKVLHTHVFFYVLLGVTVIPWHALTPLSVRGEAVGGCEWRGSVSEVLKWPCEVASPGATPDSLHSQY